MEPSSLRHILRSICVNTQWTYAVFWKLKHGNRMLLIWEDGYCDYMKLGFMKSNSEYGRESEDLEMLSCIQQSNISSVYSSEFASGIAIGYMSHLQYAFGEGVIGRVAQCGNERWAFTGDLGSGEGYFPETQFPDEWLPQISIGIKTILLVPVLPHGVLQLGSVGEVAKNRLLIVDIRDKFNSFQQKVNTALSDNLTRLPCMEPSLGVNHSVAPSYYNQPPEQSQSERVDGYSTASLPQQAFSTSANLHLMVQRLLPHSERGSFDATESFHEGDPQSPTSDFLEASILSTPYDINNDLQGALRNDPFSLACMEEVIQCSFLLEDTNLEPSVESLDKSLCSYSSGGETEKSLEDNNITDHTNTGELFSFPVSYELHKALSPPLQTRDDVIPWDSYELDDYVFTLPSYLGKNMEFTYNYDQSDWEAYHYFDIEDRVDHFPQAVMPDVLENLVGFEPHDSFRDKPSDASSVQTGSSPSTVSLQSEVKSNRLVEEPAKKERVMTSFDAENTSHDSTASDLKNASKVTTLVEEMRRKNHHFDRNRKLEKQPRKKKRKVRENTGHKSRPRDRQLIQDRLKELRELIPNSSTCSIDSLLQKAVRRMIFLSGVTEQAQKLREFADMEVDAGHNLTQPGELHVKQSWGAGVKNNLEPFSVVIKDLNCPGYMLLEMPCSDQALFFEITEVISNLGLMILKGVMEIRLDDTWALLVVQGPRGFSRLEIFIPLMQLLQLHRNTSLGPHCTK